MSEYTDVMRQFPLDPKPDIAAFSSFLDIYYSKFDNRTMPSWSDFKVTDFLGWHPNMALSEKAGDDYRFKIFGTGFVDLFGHDYTGAFICETMAAGHIDSLKKHFQLLVDGPMIGWVKGQLPLEERDYLPFEVIDLPLRGENDEVISFIHLLGVKLKK